MKRQMKQGRDVWQTLFYKILCGALLAGLFAACKSTAAGTAGSGAEIMKSEEAFFASMLDRTFRFSTLSARLKLELKGAGKEMSSRAQLKMIRDDRIQLSIQPLLGIEMFRVELTADSVKILDRMNKRYMTESYDKIKGTSVIGFNFNNLQSLFTNSIFIPGESGISAGQYRRFRMTGDRYSVSLKIRDETDMLYTFTADGGEALRSTSVRDRAGSHTLTWDYSDFQPVDSRQFPFRMEARLTSGDEERGVVTLTFSPPEIDSPLKTDFNIPSEYKRITFAQIIKSLEKQ
ncbi:MAG: DUF4292 domain-containing protein [Tannerella sp.]|jgi:hypothetical protein|nr:DUF4292 domain-containing protein [Tannerella sp.]